MLKRVSRDDAGGDHAKVARLSPAASAIANGMAAQPKADRAHEVRLPQLMPAQASGGVRECPVSVL